MADTLQARIARALSQIQDPKTRQDVISTQKVRDIGTTTSGKVRVSLVFEAGDDPELAARVRRAFEQVDGVTEATVHVVEPPVTSRPAGRSPLPVMTPPAQPRPSAPRSEERRVGKE